MADVFISYHDKTNGAIASRIAAALENAGISCWYAKRDVSAGDDFAHEVITQIENCKMFLLLLDEGAVRSPHVQSEVGNAFGRRKKIMPYQTDKRDVKNVEWVQYYFKHTQIVPLPDYDKLTEKIATELGRLLETVTPELQSTESALEMVMPKPQPMPELFPAQQPKKRLNIDGVFTILFIIPGNIVGFIIGRQIECIIFFSQLFDVDFTSPLGRSFCGVLGAFAGYYVALSIGRIVLFDGSIHFMRHLRAWTFEGIILGIIIGFIVGSQEGFVGALLMSATCACVSFGLICMPLAFIFIKLWRL